VRWFTEPDAPAVAGSADRYSYNRTGHERRESSSNTIGKEADQGARVMAADNHHALISVGDRAGKFVGWVTEQCLRCDGHGGMCLGQCVSQFPGRVTARAVDGR